jgi:hypothetical protein
VAQQVIVTHLWEAVNARLADRRVVRTVVGGEDEG